MCSTHICCFACMYSYLVQALTVAFCISYICVTTGYGDSVETLLRRTPVSSHNPNALVAFSKGMRAVKLCTNKFPQFLIVGAN